MSRETSMFRAAAATAMVLAIALVASACGTRLDEQTVREAVSTITAEDEEIAARALAERRLRTMQGLPPQTQLRRLVAMLARKGFGHGLALSTAREVVGSTQSD